MTRPWATGAPTAAWTSPPAWAPRCAPSPPTVEAGDEVSPGSVIGSVGQTALAEGDREAHLHLEMSQDGVEVDPAQYLPG